MIRVNLLPEEYRRIERTPLPLFLLIVAGVAVLCIAIFYCITLALGTRRLESELAQKQAEKRALEEDARNADRLEAEIASYAERLNTIMSIRASKIYWSKKLDLLAKHTPSDIWFALIKMEQKDLIPAPASPETVPEVVKEFDKDRDDRLSPDELKVAKEKLRERLLKEKDGGYFLLECYQKSHDLRKYANYRDTLRRNRVFYTDLARMGLPQSEEVVVDDEQVVEEDREVLKFKMFLYLKPQMELQR